MTDLTGKIWEMYTKVDTSQVEIGDIIESPTYGKGVVYGNKNMIRAAFPKTETTMQDVWFITPNTKTLRVGAFSALEQWEGNYDVVRSLLNKVENK